MRSDDDEAPRSRVSGWLATGLVLLLGVVWWPGCREYPPVTSPESLNLMKLLYAACNTRDPARLARVEEKLALLIRSNRVTESERTAFEQLVARARAGDWETAEKGAFRFAQDQVGQGHPAKEK